MEVVKKAEPAKVVPLEKAKAVAKAPNEPKAPKEAKEPKAPKAPKVVKAEKPTTEGNGVVLKADGTPDKRYKNAVPLKKDGTPDKRYKANKKG